MYKVRVLSDVQSGLEALFSDDVARHREVSSTVQQLGSTVGHTIEEFSPSMAKRCGSPSTAARSTP